MTRRRPTRENHERLRVEALVRFAEMIGLASARRLTFAMASHSVEKGPWKIVLEHESSNTSQEFAPVRSIPNRPQGVLKLSGRGCGVHES